MIERKVEVTEADVPEIDGITKPDYEIKFTVIFGERSLDEVVQERGKAEWAKMHGETPIQVYFKRSQ